MDTLFTSRRFGSVQVNKLTYEDETPLIELIQEADGELILTLSLYLPGYVHHLRHNEFFAASLPEYTDLITEAVISGLLRDTGVRITVDSMAVPIWRCQ